MTPLVYLLVVLAITVYFLLIPRRRFPNPPQPDSDDDGGEPLDDGLPDLDLPPGITRPINDWEPDSTGARNDRYGPPPPPYYKHSAP